jgi:hypothetical protein
LATFQARNATTAFAYGDPREALLSAAHLARQRADFCRGAAAALDGGGGGGAGDDACRGSNYFGSDIVAALEALNSYGLQVDELSFSIKSCMGRYIAM